MFSALRSLFRTPATAEAKMAAKTFVVDTIKAEKVVVFSKTYCPYCVKAKKALNQFTTKYAVIELDQRGDGDAIQDALLEVTGGRSVPRVFIGGTFIGGGDDTAAKAASGELQGLLQAVGAL
ncbi:MAG: thioredoxin-like protein [Monoraphidium minutum]|nr:MAG: thioredoxin-like protein [Monoraphidium minutum]